MFTHIYFATHKVSHDFIVRSGNQRLKNYARYQLFCYLLHVMQQELEYTLKEL